MPAPVYCILCFVSSSGKFNVVNINFTRPYFYAVCTCIITRVQRYIRCNPEKQEAQLSPRDRAMRRVS